VLACVTLIVVFLLLSQTGTGVHSKSFFTE